MGVKDIEGDVRKGDRHFSPLQISLREDENLM